MCLCMREHLVHIMGLLLHEHGGNIHHLCGVLSIVENLYSFFDVQKMIIISHSLMIKSGSNIDVQDLMIDYHFLRERHVLCCCLHHMGKILPFASSLSENLAKNLETRITSLKIDPLMNKNTRNVPRLLQKLSFPLREN